MLDHHLVTLTDQRSPRATCHPRLLKAGGARLKVLKGGELGEKLPPETRDTVRCEVLAREGLTVVRDRRHLVGVRLGPAHALEHVAQRALDRHVVDPRHEQRVPPFIERRVGEKDG